MSANRWLDRTQPQTLFMGVILLYVNSGFLALSHLSNPLALLIAAGGVAAGYGIANEKKWIAPKEGARDPLASIGEVRKSAINL